MSTVLQSVLDGDERLPLYQRLADAIRNDIIKGIKKPGDKLPSENILAKELGLAAGTVRQALAKLVEQGTLERFHGKGTFVRTPSFDKSMFRFFRVHGEGGERVLPESVILERRIEKVPDAVADQLQIEQNAPAIYMERLRKVNGETVMAEELWLPLEPFQSFMDTSLEEVGNLLYPAYASLCNLTVVKVDEVITVGIADKTIADSLQIQPSDPIVIIDRLALGYEGKPLEWRRSKGRASQFQYHVEIR